MFRTENRNIAAVIILAAGLLAGSVSLPGILKSRMDSLLSHHGAGNIVIDAMAQNGSKVTFENIHLGDGTSTIGSLHARVNWPGIFSYKPFSTLEIAQLNLSGTIDRNGILTIAGLKPSAALSLAETADVVVNDAHLDLATPSSGTIRLDANGQLSLQPNGSRKFESVIQSHQDQLALDMRWSGTTRRDETWTADSEIKNFNLFLTNLKIGNAAGWVGFETPKGSSLPALSGQITAEKIIIGSSAFLGNAAITIDGPLNAWHVILSGESGPARNLIVHADLHQTDKGIAVHATLESPSLDDLLQFVTDLNDGLQSFAAGNAVLTTLLITPGNFSRIRQSVSMLPYDTLELVMDGTVYDLTAKIITRKLSEGGAQESVVSMNPGD